MAASASAVGLLQAQVAAMRQKYGQARAFGFRVAGPWNGPPTLRVGGEELAIAYCPSALAFRARLAASEGGPAVVLLTDRSEEELGADVLARLARRRLGSLNSWEALRERFGVREIDPRLYRHTWLPDVLLAVADGSGVQPAGQVLDAEDVWQALLERLGFHAARPDLDDLLAWTGDPERLAAFAALQPDARTAYSERLAETTGRQARRSSSW